MLIRTAYFTQFLNTKVAWHRFDENVSNGNKPTQEIFIRYLVITSLIKNKWYVISLMVLVLFMLSFDKQDVAVCER